MNLGAEARFCSPFGGKLVKTQGTNHTQKICFSLRFVHYGTTPKMLAGRTTLLTGGI